MKKFAVVFVFPFFVQCASQPSSNSEIPVVNYHRTPVSKNLEGVKIPVLQSRELEKRWGKPEITVLKNGGYSLRYTNPKANFEELTLYGAPGRFSSDAPEPPAYSSSEFDGKPEGPSVVKRSQSWSTANVLGKPVHYYLKSPGDGADAATFSTITFSPDLPGQPVASYRLLAYTNIPGPEKVVESYFKMVGF